MRKLALSAIGILANCFVFGQSATVNGIVKDYKTTQTIPFANVIYGASKGTATDLDGKYTLTLNPGTYKIKYSSVGYDTIVKKVTLTAGETKKINVFLKEKSEVLKTAVVSAGKFEQDLSRVSVSMDVIDPELVENKATTNANDIVAQVPSVHIQEEQVSIRGGAGFSYGAGSRVLLMVDDVPMLSGDAGDVKWNYLPIENLQNIEVIKGASSVLYGSSALNGVINIRTGFPKANPITKVNIIGAMYDKPYAKRNQQWWSGYRGQQGLNFYHSRIIKKNFDLTVGGNFFRDQGFRKTEYEERGRININTRYRDQKIKGLSYGINMNGQLANNGIFFAWRNQDSVLHPSPNTSSETKNNRFNIDPFIDYFTKSGDKHSLKTRMFNTSNNSLTTANQSSVSNLFYGEYQFQKNIDSSFKVTSGLMGTYTGVKSDLYGDHSSSNVALYSQLDKMLFNDKLNVSLGIRGEYFKIDDEESESTITLGGKKLPFQPVVRAGLNYQVSEFTFLRTSYGQGYRFPTIAEKFVATSLNVISVYPNPILEPETGWSAELGIKQGVKIGEWQGFVDVAGFINQYDNMMEYTFGTFDTLNYAQVVSGTPNSVTGFMSRNIQAARITGIDASIVGKGKIGGVNLTVLAGYTFMNPKPINPDSAYLATFSSLVSDTSGTGQLGYYDENIDLSPDSVSTNLKYRFNHLFKLDVQLDYNRFSTGVSVRYNSFIHNVDQTFVMFGNISGLNFLEGLSSYRKKMNPNGVTVIDYRVSYELNEYTKLSLVVNNVLNREYQARPGYPMPPRTFVTQLSLKF